MDNWARHHVAEPGHGSEGKVPFELLARSWTPHGQMRVRETSVVSSGPLTDRTKAEDGVESGIVVRFWMKSSRTF